MDGPDGVGELPIAAGFTMRKVISYAGTVSFVGLKVSGGRAGSQIVVLTRIVCVQSPKFGEPKVRKALSLTELIVLAMITREFPLFG